MIDEEDEKGLYHQRNLYKIRWDLRLFTRAIYGLRSRLERLYKNLGQRKKQRRRIFLKYDVSEITDLKRELESVKNVKKGFEVFYLCLAIL